METYKFIADENELKFFWDYGIPPLKKNEIYFVSLAARNKMLSEEERKGYAVGRSEMFAKQQIRHDYYQEFIKHIRRFEVRLEAYLTKTGVPYPQKCLVCYWNLCPVDAYKAMKDQMSYMTETLQSLADSAIKNSQNGIDEAFYKIRKSFDTCQSLFARNFGEKLWIDFDIDCDNITNDEYSHIHQITTNIFGLANVMFVKTFGGIHMLVRKFVFHQNPQEICNKLKEILPRAKEIVRNTNEMIPLPGTYQYGIPVIILNKEDFKETTEFYHGHEVP